MNILIVDDDEYVRSLLRKQFKAGSHRVVSANDGMEALAVLEQEPVDVIIADILMPRMDGYRLCLAVRRHDRFKDIPFVFQTAVYTSEPDERLALEVGGDVFLHKPASADTILEALRPVMNRPRKPRAPGLPETEVTRRYADRFVSKLEARTHELTAAETKFQTLVEQCVVGNFVIQDGCFAYVNPRLAEILGWPAEELAARPVLDCIAPEDRGQVDEFLRQLAAGESPSIYGRWRMLHQTGRVLQAEVHAGVIPAFHGRPAVIGTLLDTTQRHRAEQRLAAFAALGQRLNATTQVKEAARIIVTVADELFGWDACMVVLYDARTDRCEPVLNMDVVGGRRQDVAPARAHHDPSPRMRRAIESGAELILRDAPPAMTAEAQPFGDVERPSASILIVPVRNGQKVIGLISIQSYQPGAYSLEDRDALQALADHCGGALERIQSRSELEREHHLLRTLIDLIPRSIFVKDTAGRYLVSNQAHAQSLGVADPAELLGRTAGDFLPSEAVRAIEAEDQRVLRHGQPVMDQEELHERAGERAWHSITMVPLRSQTGELAGLVGMKQDITGRKLAEEELRASRHLLEQAQQIGRIGSWVADPGPEGSLVWSKETARIFGLPPGECSGKVPSIATFMHPEDLAMITAAARAALADQGAFDLEHRIVRPDGQVRWVHQQADVKRAADGRPERVVGVVRDITDRRQLEDQLRQAQKMEAIGQLAGGIAHDFNNILGTILGNVELARMSQPGSHGSMECLEAILQASRRAADLVKQILAFSRRDEQKRRPIQLHLVVREALKLLRASVPAAIEFQADVAITRTALADPTQIHQVTMNLCTNAWHAMRDRPGILRVELAEVEVDADQARVNPDLHPGPYVRLTVADNGCGMDRATLARIFEPFFTTKPPGEGTGLGLSVVHGIIKSHDGGITVHSQPGEGTTFQLYFPVFESEPAALVDVALPIPRGQGQHVLVVDDEEPLASLGKNILERLGYRATHTTSPTEALAWFEQRPGQFDLVITDFNMPGMSGTAFAQALLALQPELPIILTTGYNADLTPEMLAAIGIRGFLPKPNNVRSLGEAVHRALAEVDFPEPLASVLLVDDDDACAEMLQKNLRRFGYRAIRARDGTEALELYDPQSINVVLSDLIMPGKDGVELIMELRRRHPAAKIIAMSGGGRNQPAVYLSVAQKLGAMKTLTKPFPMQELQQALAECLAKG